MDIEQIINLLSRTQHASVAQKNRILRRIYATYPRLKSMPGIDELNVKMEEYLTPMRVRDLSQIVQIEMARKDSMMYLAMLTEFTLHFFRGKTAPPSGDYGISNKALLELLKSRVRKRAATVIKQIRHIEFKTERKVRSA